MRTRLRTVLFGLATAGSLGFGGSQALAAPSAQAACGDVPWEFPLSCPTPRDCGAECAARGYYDGGFCAGNCCTCAI
jgi:hypothetical protein